VVALVGYDVRGAGVELDYLARTEVEHPGASASSSSGTW
jgi:hypothetical protein